MMQPAHLRAVLIAGPTASGKSGLALELARALNGVVINADSMQVYAELPVLTARPSAEDMCQAPHALYGHVSAAEAYSAGRWIKDAAQIIGHAERDGRLPIIVGGTGLYFKALIEGLSPIPDIPDPIRRHWRGEVALQGAAVLHRELASRDPEMAGRLNPKDQQRVTRALEVLDATGRSLGDWQKITGEPVLRPDETYRLVLAPDRAVLYQRCDRRFDAMMNAGALDEARRLAAFGLDAGLPAMRALGVRPLLAHDRGAISLAEAMAQSKAETRQYAKRQMTWLKSNMIAWNWHDAQDSEIIVNEILPLIAQLRTRAR